MQRFLPQEDELDGLDQIISEIPELQNMISSSSYSLDQIIAGIDKLEILDPQMKLFAKQVFVNFQKSYVTNQVYKYKSFKNQEIIEQLLEREKQYKSIIESQSKKHNDSSGLDEMNKMFSTLVIKPDEGSKLSRYTSKKIKDLKTFDDFQPIFQIEGSSEYTKEELMNMKSNPKKGPMFKGVKSINVKNSKDDTIVIKK